MPLRMRPQGHGVYCAPMLASAGVFAPTLAESAPIVTGLLGARAVERAAEWRKAAAAHPRRAQARQSSSGES